MTKKPSPAQLRALQNLNEGKEPFDHLIGTSASHWGGAHTTWLSIVKNGWATGGGTITDAGREVLLRQLEKSK